MDDADFSNEEALGAISSEEPAMLRPVSRYLGAGVQVILAEAAAQSFEVSDPVTLTMLAFVQLKAAKNLKEATKLFRITPSLLDDIDEQFGILTEPIVTKFAMDIYTFNADNNLSPLTREKMESEYQAVVESLKTGGTPNPGSFERAANDIERVVQVDTNANPIKKRGSLKENGEAWDAALEENFRGLLKDPISKLFSAGFSAEGWLRGREKDLYANQFDLQARISASIRNPDLIKQQGVLQSLLEAVREDWDTRTPELRSDMRELLRLRAQTKKGRENQPQVSDELSPKLLF